ncbi:hypothetical protein BJV82DRAFT_103049 [Fennellomyces sp. T-0311]|nr:hypothetical protein BJV82DRAFT_103049 [Fennellomyces sp. T-0311]
MAQCEEIDGIYVNASGPSVGTTIKREALYMNSQYKSGQKLTSRERKIMVAGMSSILDIADNSMESQRSLFSSSEWDLLSSYFNKKFRIKTNPLPVFLDDTWTILSKLPIETGKHYLYKALASSTLSKEDRNMLKIMEHCLDVMDDYAYLLTKAVVPRLYTEQDYFRILWSRLLELLFGTSKNVRIKAGESAPIYCTNNKAQLYPDQENIIGFKIDGRLIVDIGDNENDLAAIEVAKDDEDRKIIRDMGKLIREAKDDLDNLIQNIAGGKRDPSIFTWMLQIAGANCSISTIHLAGNGLYTTVYQHSFDLPLSVDAFPTFRNTLKFLLAMKEHITKTANKFVEVKSRRNSIRDNLGQFASESSDDEDYPWTRDTWYTPLRDDPKRSVIPDHMFGHSSKPLDRTLLVPEDSTITVEHVAMPSQLEGIDPFGFKKVESGWYNVHTGKTTEAHPLHSGDQSAV